MFANPKKTKNTQEVSAVLSAGVQIKKYRLFFSADAS
jgi:hypothetical protein